MARKRTPESYVLDACRDYLQMKGWFVMRMNSGAVQDRRGIPVRMHAPGTADLLAMRRSDPQQYFNSAHSVCWVECKAANGVQSEKQKAFAEKVIYEGHRYILAYGIDDLVAAGL